MKQNPILIQGQMEEEISYIKEKMEEVETKVLYGFEFYIGKIENYPIILSKGKIGSTNITLATFIGIIEFQPKIVINQGLAGAHDLNLHRGDIVIGESSININCYSTQYKEKGKGSNPFEWKIQTFEKQTDHIREYKADKELLKLVKEQLNNYQEGKIVFGKIGSGDCWNKEYDRIGWLHETLNTLCEDMETVYCYQVCEQYHVPTIGIRIISNNERRQERYKKDKTGILIQQFIIQIVKEIIKKQN